MSEEIRLMLSMKSRNHLFSIGSPILFLARGGNVGGGTSRNHLFSIGSPINLWEKR